jgi:DNA-binding GntR family transcriptional regulator
MEPVLFGYRTKGTYLRPLSRVEGVRRHILQGLRNGDQRPGSAINVREVAVGLGTSPTPVREALERLAGEGIVHAGRGERGFTVPRYVARELSDLYRLLGTLLQIAHRDSGTIKSDEDVRKSIEDGAPALAVESVLSLVASQTTSRILSGEIGRIINMLAPYRVEEPRIIPNWREELSDLRASLIANEQVVKSFRFHTKLRLQRVAALIESVDGDDHGQIY